MSRAVKNIAAPEKPDPRCAHQSKFQRSTRSKTGFRGVYLHGAGFRAVISENGRLVSLGTFKTAREASAAFNLAAKRREVEKVAKTGSATEVAQGVVRLIQLVIASSRIEQEALRQFQQAAQVLSGIGKGSGAAVGATAALATDAVDRLHPSPKHSLGPHRTSVAAR